MVFLVQRFRQSTATPGTGVSFEFGQCERMPAGVLVPLRFGVDHPARRASFFVSVGDGDELSGFPSVESSEGDSPLSGDFDSAP